MSHLKGRCVHQTGMSLGLPSRGGFYGTDTVFHLELGEEYLIMGLGMFESVLLALVCDETEKPNWLPVGAFEFESLVLPADWEFVLLDAKAASGGDASDRWVARWGYPDLVRDGRHSDALIERDPEALEVFFRELRKASSG